MNTKPSRISPDDVAIEVSDGYRPDEKCLVARYRGPVDLSQAVGRHAFRKRYLGISPQNGLQFQLKGVDGVTDVRFGAFYGAAVYVTAPDWAKVEPEVSEVLRRHVMDREPVYPVMDKIGNLFADRRKKLIFRR